VDLLTRSTNSALVSYSGPLLDAKSGRVAAPVTGDVRQSLETWLSAYSSGSCRLVAALLPQGARYLGYSYSASDDGGSGDCPPAGSCEIRHCRWLGEPQVATGDGVAVVYGFFENRSGARQRIAGLTVFFQDRGD
jgi:hypothetical protein